ncbi:MAG: isocitrate lyase/phosphoenolpyruvate mutase family protein [Actinobacteria bacterium]|nr:isocitrate lyase/phosphoenolpyruvate mutase family protein [Actinomycetota bacterium]
MHRERPILVLPNAWDVTSAQLLAAIPGCRALATSSAAVARSLGYEDGEQAPRDAMVAAAERISAAVDLPVTADLEAGYGDPVGTAAAAWAAGLVGINFEDSPGDRLLPVAEQVAHIAAIRDAVPDLVLNARVDVFLNGSADVAEAIARGNAYLRAGADCIYPILCPPAAIGRLAEGIGGPVNVLAEQGVPGPAELQALGVSRLTWGGGLARSAYAEAVRIVTDALGRPGRRRAVSGG